MKHTILGISILLSSTALFAQEQQPPVFETVVEDVMFNSSDRVIIDERTIKDSRAPNITTLLSTQANITVTTSPFQPNSIYIRGGDAGHVLILVDGVPFYDASNAQRTFNLNSLDIKSVRRIEVLKGSQTVLYGGQALSGVIKIDTIPQEVGSKTGLQGQIGTQDMRDITAVHSQLATDNQGLVMRGHGAWKESKSPILDSSNTYSQNNWSGEATYLWKGPAEGYIKGSYIQERNYSPAPLNSYQVADSNDFQQYSRQLGFSSALQFRDAFLEPHFTLGIQNSLRQFDQPVSSSNPMLTDEDYDSNLRTVRAHITPYKDQNVSTLLGASYTYEDIHYKSSNVEIANALSEQYGVFGKMSFNIYPHILLSLGGRWETWKEDKHAGTAQIGLALFRDTKLEWSNGYKIPSLFQLYSSYGNPDLKEERASQYTLTQEFQISPRQQLSLSLFYTEFSDLIVVQGSYPSLQYQNVQKAESRGVEVLYSLRPTANSSLFFTYGYQEPRDLDKAQWLIRRALVSGSVKYLHTYSAHTGSIEVVGKGEILDRTGSTSYRTLPGYAVANLAYSYDWGQGLSLYTRLNNVLDHRYQESYSWYNEGFSGVAGAEYWF
ncbi:MAG: TonB-dependent receptor [Bdellovibrio sp.]